MAKPYRTSYCELPEPQPQPCPVNAARVAAIRLAADVDARIKRAHDARGCTTWETWTSTERDQTGRKFTARWTGCRACHVQLMEN